jgi:hypothetical protein
MKTWKNGFLKEYAVEIDLPSKPREWEIYSMAGAGKVATRLNGALRKTLRRFDTLIKKGAGVSVAAEKAMDEMMYPTLSKYREFGACDTEVPWVAKDCLRRYAVKRGLIFNIYGLFY